MHDPNESVIIRDVRQQFYSCFSKPKNDRTAKGLLALPQDKTAAAAGRTVNVGYQLFWSGREGVTLFHEIPDDHIIAIAKLTAKQQAERYIDWHKHVLMGALNTPAEIDVAAADLQNKAMRNPTREVMTELHRTTALKLGAVLHSTGNYASYDRIANHQALRVLLESGRDGDWTLFVSPKLKSEEKSYWTADYTISIILTELRWRDLDSHLSIDSFIEMCKEK